MTFDELEQKIETLRSRPLTVVCLDRKGRERTMTLAECRRTGSVFLHVAADELDKLLGAELGGDALPVEKQKCNKTATKNYIFSAAEEAKCREKSNRKKEIYP